jgi:membrane peptidoglycan carboxypeptidase
VPIESVDLRMPDGAFWLWVDGESGLLSAKDCEGAVQTADGDDLIRYPLRMLPQPRREAIGVLNYALTQVVEQGTAKALPGLLGKPGTVAGKTGTTNDRRDSWFVGYTRNHVAAAWVGEDDNSPAGVAGADRVRRPAYARWRVLALGGRGKRPAECERL